MGLLLRWKVSQTAGNHSTQIIPERHPLPAAHADEARRAALRAYTEEAVREGLAQTPWEQLIRGVILGGQAFAQAVSNRLRPQAREQSGARRLRPRIRWEPIVQAVESVKGGRGEGVS